MGTVIEFPQRGGTEVLHFDEKHSFGEIGGLTLSRVQKQHREDGPLLLLLLEAPMAFTPWSHWSRQRKA